MDEKVKRSDDSRPRRTTKVSRKNQVTLPVAALAEAHVKSGDILRVEVEDDGIFRLIRHRDPRLDLLGELAGAAPGLAAATNLQELRDEWER